MPYVFCMYEHIIFEYKQGWQFYLINTIFKQLKRYLQYKIKLYKGLVRN